MVPEIYSSGLVAFHSPDNGWTFDGDCTNRFLGKVRTGASRLLTSFGLAVHFGASDNINFSFSFFFMLMLSAVRGRSMLSRYS